MITWLSETSTTPNATLFVMFLAIILLIGFVLFVSWRWRYCLERWEFCNKKWSESDEKLEAVLAVLAQVNRVPKIEPGEAADLFAYLEPETTEKLLEEIGPEFLQAIGYAYLLGYQLLLEQLLGTGKRAMPARWPPEEVH